MLVSYGCRALAAKEAASPELLSSVNPTFTGVRLAQRIPVRVHIPHVPPRVLVSAGMTCTVVKKEGAAPQIGLGKSHDGNFWSTFELVSRLAE